MSIENAIKGVIEEKLNDGTVEAVVAEEFKKTISKSVESLFTWNGEGKKIIEEELRKAIIPHVSGYKYDQHVTKLDAVLIDLIDVLGEDNNKLLENFQEYMDVKELPEKIKISDIYIKWMKRVESDVSTDDLEVEFDDGPHYETVEVIFEVFEEERPSWSSLHRARVVMECEHDEDMNAELFLTKWDNDQEWELEKKAQDSISSLRYIGDFELYLLRLQQRGTKIELDEHYSRDDICPEAEPEPSY